MSHTWAGKLKKGAKDAGKVISNTAANVKDDITRDKHKTKDTDFSDIQKNFDEQNKLITTVNSDVVAFISAAEAILTAQTKLAEDLSKIAPDGSPMAALCKQQMDTVNQMFKMKSENFDKQIATSFTDPVNVYQGQYREISDRIRERSRRETEMDKLYTERDKFTEKADARLAATETKLEAAIGAYEDLNAELKRDIPVLLSKAGDFFSPLMLLLIINQANFWSQMSQFTTQLASRVDTSKAVIPEISQCITPKQSSAVTKKYATMTANPWEKGPTTPALTYGNTPAALPGPYNNAPPQALPPTAGYGAQPPYGGPPAGAVPPGGPPRPSGVRAPPGTPGQAQPPQQTYVPPQQTHAPPQQQSYVPQPGNPFAQPNATPAVTPPVVTPPPNPFAGRPLPQAKPQAKALWDFNGSNHDELSFRAGDFIIIHDKTGDWWKGELNGKIGVLPGNYVQLC
jgi:hypothetical protein